MFAVHYFSGMSKLYLGRYRGSSRRKKGWDYGSNASYFVTIRSRAKCFGEVVNKRVVLSRLGIRAEECWAAIPDHFPFVRLDAYVIMPDHVHGLLRFEKENYLGKKGGNNFGPQSMNLGSVVRGFKVGVVKAALQEGLVFSWQPRYFDTVVTNYRLIAHFRKYIRTNFL
jgi:putative transposase